MCWSVPEEAHCENRKTVFDSVKEMGMHVAILECIMFGLLRVIISAETLNKANHRWKEIRKELEELLYRRRQREITVGGVNEGY